MIVIDDPDDAVPLAARSPTAACRAPRSRFARRAPPRRCGASRPSAPTCCSAPARCSTPSRRRRRADGGREFIVAPGFNPRVVDYCLGHDIPVFPGVCTPTEIEAALRTGLTTLKFFPAEPIGGLAFLKAMAAPYVDVKFMPTGGINAANVASYLAFKRVVACGGSWMAPHGLDRREAVRSHSRRVADARRRSRAYGTAGSDHG